jgi:hypothetical protein
MNSKNQSFFLKIQSTKEFPSRCIPRCSLPYSQEPTRGSCVEVRELSPRLNTLPKIYFNIIPLSKPKPLKYEIFCSASTSADAHYRHKYMFFVRAMVVSPVSITVKKLNEIRSCCSGCREEHCLLRH